MLKFMKWTVVIAGIVVIPLLIRKQYEKSVLREMNIRYDIDDYVSEVNL